MTDIALTVIEVFPHSRLLEFLNRGSLESAAHKLFRLLGGKTYEEWFEYFEANDFKPKNLREAPIFVKVMAILYQGMVLEAEDAAESWLTLSESERQEYKSEALALAQREIASLNFWDTLECAFGSFLVFHNFFRDFDLMEKSLDKYVAIIFEAVANEKISEDSEKKLQTAFRSIETDIKDKDLQSNSTSVASGDGLEREKALAVLNSMWIKIPESEREQKNQELRKLLRSWREEDINERYNDTP